MNELIQDIKLQFLGGTQLDRAISKAHEVSLHYGCDVEFNFNGNIHTIKYHDKRTEHLAGD